MLASTAIPTESKRPKIPGKVNVAWNAARIPITIIEYSIRVKFATTPDAK
jgi:hypothetical protein